MSMCFVSIYPCPVFKLAVSPVENGRVWPPIAHFGRRHFIEKIVGFRTACTLWLSGKNGKIPYPMAKLLFHAEWDHYYNQDVAGLRVGFFIGVLLFFSTNDAPITLRRHFWTLLLERPVFDANRCAGAGHPYCSLWRAIMQLPTQALVELGCFYHMGSGDMLHEVNSKIEAYNIWGCRGFYDEGVGGNRRLVGTELYLSDEDHNPRDWDTYGMLSPETVSEGPDAYPENNPVDEEALSVDGSLE